MPNEYVSRIAPALRRLSDLKNDAAPYTVALALRVAAGDIQTALRESARAALKDRDDERRAHFTRLNLPMTYEQWLETKPRCDTRIGLEQCAHPIDHADNGSWCQPPSAPNLNTNPGPGNLLEWAK